MFILYSLQFTGYCGKSLEYIIKIFKKIYKNLNVISLPIKKKKIIVLKSPHIYKKSREHFETFIHKKLLILFIKVQKDFLFKKILKCFS